MAVTILLACVLGALAQSMELDAQQQEGQAAALPPQSLQIEVDVAKPPALRNAPVIEMKNQHGELTTLDFPRDKPHILFAADKDGVEDVIDWHKRIEERYGDAFPAYGLAQCKAVPALLRPVVKRIIRRKVPQPVFLDWTNKLAEAWHIEEDAANIYLIAPSGAILIHLTGGFCEEKAESLFVVLDDLAATLTKTAATSE